MLDRTRAGQCEWSADADADANANWHQLCPRPSIAQAGPVGEEQDRVRARPLGRPQSETGDPCPEAGATKKDCVQALAWHRTDHQNHRPQSLRCALIGPSGQCAPLRRGTNCLASRLTRGLLVDCSAMGRSWRRASYLKLWRELRGARPGSCSSEFHYPKERYHPFCYRQSYRDIDSPSAIVSSLPLPTASSVCAVCARERR